MPTFVATHYLARKRRNDRGDGTPIVHSDDPWVYLTLCNRTLYSAQWVTTQRRKVTCLNCQKKLASRRKR